MKLVRQLDKLVDEIAKGRSMENPSGKLTALRLFQPSPSIDNEDEPRFGCATHVPPICAL